jgi:hypothetical protein
MINLRNIAAKSIVVKVLRKTPAILGCLMFLFSSTSPFYYLVFIRTEGAGSTQFWSYRDDYQAWSGAYMSFHRNQDWFSDYWFSDLGFVQSVSWILISMFSLQALTLVFGVASVISNRRVLSFAPVPLSLAVMTLMMYTGQILAGSWQEEYKLGYYLIYPSIAMFASAFALNEVIKKRQTTNLTKDLELS